MLQQSLLSFVLIAISLFSRKKLKSDVLQDTSQAVHQVVVFTFRLTTLGTLGNLITSNGLFTGRDCYGLSNGRNTPVTPGNVISSI